MPHFNNVHIGDLIRQRIKATGMTKAEFGRRINTSRQNVNTLLRKDDISVRQLIKISQVLNHDFFQYLNPGGEKSPELNTNFVQQSSISLTIHHLNPGDLRELYGVISAWQKN